jgi:hypothetical protein
LTLGEREGDRGAEIKIGEVGGAKVGILRHHRIESNVDSSEGGDIGGGRTGGGETVTSRSAANATTNVIAERARRAGAEKSGRSPLLLHDAVEVGGCGGVSVDGGEGTGALDELDEFVVVAGCPLAPKGAGQGRTKSEGLARRVHVEDGGTR